MKGCIECLKEKKPPFAEALKEIDKQAIRERLKTILNEGQESKELTLPRRRMPLLLRFAFWLQRWFPKRVEIEAVGHHFKVIEVPDSWVWCECSVYLLRLWVTVGIIHTCYERCWCSDGTEHWRTCCQWWSPWPEPMGGRCPACCY